MIELEKQEEPTQQEIQNYVNQVYDYAIDLYTNQKLSWEQVRDELIRQGVEVEDASTVVENLQNQEIKELFSNNMIKTDVLSLFFGFFLSLLSDSNQRPRDYKSRALAN